VMNSSLKICDKANRPSKTDGKLYYSSRASAQNGRVWIQSRAATAKTKVAATLAGLCAHHMEAPETETLLLHPACLVGVYGGDEVMNGLKSQLESKEDVDKLLPS
ncbi:hypothetical protein PC128_g25916, partial [Phytophthora cactorum]